MERIKLYIHNNKPLLYNLQYIFVSIFLIIIINLIDFEIIDISAYIPDLIKMSAESSKNILTTLAGALLTITTFTFSTILVVINMYASNFSHRVIENFINKEIAMKVLGIFIGGFIYCILSILFMDFFDYELVLAGTVGVIYSIFCMAYFLRFVQSVISNFQGVNLISDISDEATKVIASEVEKRISTPEYSPKESHHKTEIFVERNGYLSFIDYKRIVKIFDKGEIFNVEVRLGDYITENTLVGTAFFLKDGLKEEEIERIKECFYLQDKKVSSVNYRYNMTKIYEIAARALSPGVNDPNTAVHCINKLGVLLRPLAEIDQYHIQYVEIDGAQIFYTSYKFYEDLGRYFIPLVNYAKGDLMVIVALLESLYIMLPAATERNKKSIQYIMKYMEEKTKPLLTTSLEKDYLSRYFKINTEEIEEV